MGVLSCSQEISSQVAPARLFKALCIDSHTLFPKLIPEAFKSIEFVEGDCATVGAVKQLNFPQGSPFKYCKHRIDELDVENFYCQYSTTEGDVLGDMVEYVVHEVKFVPSVLGSVCTMSSHYHPKGDAVLDEERIKMGQGKVKEMFKKVEAHLLANPHLYA